MLSPSQIHGLMDKLVRAHEQFIAHGGKRCHCGGHIYPGERYTCTHGGKPMTREEIASIRREWDLEDMERAGGNGGG